MNKKSYSSMGMPQKSVLGSLARPLKASKK